jgi:hypothetical protein
MTIMSRNRPRLTLDYSTRRDGETEWTPRKEHIWLDSTPCNFGGERTWFLCPFCQNRRAVLFSVAGVFACRTCHNLAHASTRDSETEACNRRIRRIEDRLGGDATGRGFLWRVPEKPAGMHWETHDRLVWKLLREHERRNELFAESTAKLIARFDRAGVR